MRSSVRRIVILTAMAVGLIAMAPAAGAATDPPCIWINNQPICICFHE